jgi:phage tail sheath gpL-like
MSETLGFEYFPASTFRPSGFFAEFNSALANTALANQVALIIGQGITGTLAAANTNVPILATSQAQVNALAGNNSMLALKYAAYRAQDPFGTVYVLPLADAGGGTAATGSIAVTGPATAAGTLALYIMGVSIPVGVNSGDTATTIGANIAAAIALAAVPVTAVATTGTVALTAVHKGLALNDLDVRINYRGPQNGEVTPAGVAVTITAMSGGATNPVMTTALANLGIQAFDFIDLPYNDTASLTAVQAFLSDSAGRWSAEEMIYGHAFVAYNGTVSARSTFGVSNNDQHKSILGYQGGATGSPTPAWLEASDWCAVHAIRLKVNPALGLTGMALNLLPPPIATQDTVGERNTLLYDGISTFTVDESGQCRIDRSITTYQQNASGQIDNSYLNTNLLFQAMYAARYIKSQVTTQYVDAGLILVANGTPIGPGAPATTPNLILQGVIAMYAYLCTQFVVQNLATFARNATAGTGQKGQVLLYLPIDFSDQVIQVAALIQFDQTT